MTISIEAYIHAPSIDESDEQERTIEDCWDSLHGPYLLSGRLAFLLVPSNRNLDQFSKGWI